MPKKSKPKESLTYTYTFADGSECTIRVGQDGVTKHDISILLEFDHEQFLRNLYAQRHADRYCHEQQFDSKEDLNPDPLQRIADPHSDVFETLYPDVDANNNLKDCLRRALPELTENQLQLIDELYSQKKSITAIAQEQGVDKNSIISRRKKLLKRLEKLITKLESESE